MKINRTLRWMTCLAVVAGVLAKDELARAEEPNDHPWSVSLSAGRIDMEGDFPTKDGLLYSLLLGYDYSDWWTFEGGLFVAPNLEAQTIKGRQNPDGSFERRKPLEENGGVSETTAYGATLDALFHFTPWTRVDPYLSVGVMGLGFTDDLNDNEHSQFDGGLRGGAGVLYNVNDQWSVRADFHAALADISGKGSIHSTLELGLRYVFGANAPPRPAPVAVTRLPDSPSAAPVPTPAVPTERTETFDLRIDFADGSAEIGSQYNEHLDVIGKTLAADPAATVRIEGHTDQVQGLSERQAQRLTRDRAGAVANYLAGDKWKISSSRMTVEGYGFSRPKEKPDLEHGTPANRRIEVTILHPVTRAQ